MTRRLKTQGVYYVVGGLWPLLHFRSFEAITGPKPDRFVTEAAAALYTAIGAALLLDVVAPRRTARRLALFTALATAAVEVRHRRRIRWVYLADATIECVFVTGLLKASAGLPQARVSRATPGTEESFQAPANTREDTP